MICVKKFRTNLPNAIDWSGDIVGFVREEVGTFATVTHWVGVGQPAGEDDPSLPIYPAKIEIDLIIAAPTEGDMNSARSFCKGEVTELPLTEKEICEAHAVLARDIVRHICWDPKVYDMVVDAILSRFPAARQAPSVEEALACAYEQCSESESSVCDEGTEPVE